VIVTKKAREVKLPCFYFAQGHQDIPYRTKRKTLNFPLKSMIVSVDALLTYKQHRGERYGDKGFIERIQCCSQKESWKTEDLSIGQRTEETSRKTKEDKSAAKIKALLDQSM